MILSNQAKDILNDNELINIRDDWFLKMKSLYEGSYHGDTIYVNGILGFSKVYDAYLSPKEWMIDCLENLAQNAQTIKNMQMFKPLCVETGHYGVHFVDKLFDANVYFHDGQWQNDYVNYPIGSLKKIDLSTNKTFEIIKIATETFLEQDVKLPLFGLPTIASALNIAVNLYGEKILVEMLIEPENAKHDLKIINDLLIELHEYFIKVLPKEQLQPVISWNRTQPPQYGQLCGCTHQLVSKDIYEEFIMPLDNELLGVYKNGGMMHLCGTHVQHIPLFKQMSNLKSIQVNDKAAIDLEKYFYGLREDQLIWLNPCSEMTAKKALQITKGKRLVIADNIEKNESGSKCACQTCSEKNRG